jgi:hypothetical protein
MGRQRLFPAHRLAGSLPSGSRRGPVARVARSWPHPGANGLGRAWWTWATGSHVLKMTIRHDTRPSMRRLSDCKPATKCGIARIFGIPEPRDRVRSAIGGEPVGRRNRSAGGRQQGSRRAGSPRQRVIRSWGPDELRGVAWRGPLSSGDGPIWRRVDIRPCPLWTDVGRHGRSVQSGCSEQRGGREPKLAARTRRLSR